jgi:hypothetical protein
MGLKNGPDGGRSAEPLDLPTGLNTLPRRVKEALVEPVPLPRHAGIDYWAIRKYFRI